ncbi:MAG TPA: HlyD family efflux transporter periplasmic adaptor subunit [Verrucomicrobiae bacterium]|nr:HlyD family efflux transporter periplasmic adaptor subunit [Verrucomicrobiae bacterium]
MNSTLLNDRATSTNGASSRGGINARDRERTGCGAPLTRTKALATPCERGTRIQTDGPKIQTPAVKIPTQEPRLNSRQLIFRCVRIFTAGVLVSCAAVYARAVFTTARSEVAFVNAEIVAFRAPIAGQIRLGSFDSGRAIKAGSELFSVENARFGNEQAVAQLNWAKDSAERLQAESEEAAVRLRHQEDVTRLNEKMFAEQILPRMQLIEEQAKRDLARTILSNKIALANKAAARVAELTKQVELQQTATVTIPFDGIAWTAPAKTGSRIAFNEPVVEVIDPSKMWVEAYFAGRHASKLKAGAEVTVTTGGGELKTRGRIESARAGVGRIAFEGVAAISPSDYIAQKIAVRVRLDSRMPFEASEFYGVGRNVIVTLKADE